MDWGQLLILLILFGLPLLEFLERILKARRRGEEPRTPDAGPTEGVTQERGAPADRGHRSEPAIEHGGWLPQLPPELEWEPEAEADETAPELPAPRAQGPEEVPEAVRVHSPVVSLEPLEVDRDGEPRRFHRDLGSTGPVPGLRAAPSRLATQIQSRSDLRRAIILAEVLGRPKGLR